MVYLASEPPRLLKTALARLSPNYNKLQWIKSARYTIMRPMISWTVIKVANKDRCCRPKNQLQWKQRYPSLILWRKWAPILRIIKVTIFVHVKIRQSCWIWKAKLRAITIYFSSSYRIFLGKWTLSVVIYDLRIVYSHIWACDSVK